MLRSSGIGTYLSNLLPLVVAAKPDWRFDIIARQEDMDAGGWGSAENVSVVPCQASVYGLAEQVQLAARIRRDTDLVWSPHYNIPLSYQGPLLVTIHDVCHLALPQLVKGAHRRAYARFMFAAVKRRASRVLCDSEFTKNEFRRLVGSRNTEPATVYLGVAPRWFTVQPTAPPHPKPFLLFVGNLKPNKNLLVLINALQRTAGSIPHDLVIVGKQSGFITADESLKDAAAALGGRVRFTGEVADELLEQFFVHADAFVFPSVYEGFGLPPLEAMACGCPTIVSRAGSLPEICGDAVVYFDPHDPRELADTLVQVLSDESMREALRQRGRRHAERFSWDRCAAQTIEIMEELVHP